MQWILAGVVGLLVGVYLLITLIIRLRRFIKSRVEFSVPVKASQTIEFSVTGKKRLHIDGPMFTIRFAKLTYELIDENINENIKLHTVLFRTVSTGLSRARLLIKKFTIDHAGSYLFKINGIKNDTDYSDLFIVFTKPYTANMILYILGLILSGWIIILSIVFAGLKIAHKI